MTLSLESGARTAVLRMERRGTRKKVEGNGKALGVVHAGEKGGSSHHRGGRRDGSQECVQQIRRDRSWGWCGDERGSRSARSFLA